MSDELDYDLSDYLADDIEEEEVAEEVVESDEVDTDSDEADTDEDPWGWAKEEGVDPNAVKKTWTQYTQTREEALAEKREAEKLRAELEPMAKLRDEIYADPGLVAAIEGYMQSPDRTADRTIHDLTQKVQGLESRLAVDTEFADVEAWARAEGLPAPSKNDLVRAAIESGAGSLLAAYKVQNFDVARTKAVDKTVAGIKRSKGAKAVSSTQKDTKSRKLTKSDYANMSEDELADRWSEVLDNFGE